ncbi:hypothetical protein BDN72DRAFT_874075 [Pluteus cervinus]|uniref:Uncharacterized protein n=1 Tax=Pluteus cervinus TaxID=181527 RepID=A0ACD3BBT0_9AGAR|nr:hypothetical protein BDN72DRAFT_874075 [Pluteus cervinus]
MTLPTSREIELEALLRQRDQQLAELSDETTQLRQYLSTQPGPSTTDAITLPPTLASLLLPHIENESANRASPGSTTVTAALTQRARLLQEENDELYELLRFSETGKLKEEVRVLRRVVSRLEGALRESHQVISSLSTELNKSYDTFSTMSRQNNSVNNVKRHSQSPRTSYHQLSSGLAGNGHSSSKLPPTGPRAHKKPRMSDSQGSPPPRSNPPLPSHKSHNHSNSSSRTSEVKEYNPRPSENRGRANHPRMEVDEDHRGTTPSSDKDRVRVREKERDRGTRDRDRERDKDKERDGNKPRRNGHFAGRGGNAGGNSNGRRTERNSASNNNHLSGDRTLAERLGPSMNQSS